MTRTYIITGMTCNNCKTSVKEVPSSEFKQLFPLFLIFGIGASVLLKTYN